MESVSTRSVSLRPDSKPGPTLQLVILVLKTVSPEFAVLATEPVTIVALASFQMQRSVNFGAE